MPPHDEMRADAPCGAFGPAPLDIAPLDIASLDHVLGGGLALGRVHEIYAAEPEDAAAAAGFALTLASRLAQDRQHALLWLRPLRAMRLGGLPHGEGWAELGGAPGMALLGVVHDAMALLRATVDALRCPALGGVIAESWGPMRELDLTASRRLTLAAEKSGVPLLLLRLDAAPVPSAAQTRWEVASAPSQALPGHAPGAPTFDITLLRQKSGPCGMSWRLEWDRDQCIFREAPLSGSLVSVPADGPAQRSGAGRGAGRKTGRSAA